MPPSPEGSSWKAGPSAFIELVAGGILILAGLWPLYYGPGYGPGHEPMVQSPAVPLSTLLILVGAALAAIGSIRVIRRIVTRGESPPKGNAVLSGIAVGLSAVGLAVMVLLSQGVIQGWYYAPAGTEQVRVSCGPPSSGQFPVPYGFPPGSQVHLSWVSANGTPVRIWATQSAPNGYAAYSWTYQVNGSSGFVNLTGTGGPFSFGATPLSPCTQSWNVTLFWTYSVW